jgi:hypothetical protein
MPKQRPASVLVIAILNIIGGGLGLLGTVCSGGGQLLGGGKMFTGSTTAAPPGKQQEFTEFEEYQKRAEKFLNEELPGGPALKYGEMSVGLVLSVLMLVSGIGLLSMQSWARVLAILYAILSILHHLASLIFAVGFTLPAARDFFAKKPPGNEMINTFASIMEIILIVSVVVGFLFIIYPIVVLILMLRPYVVAAFRGEVREPEVEDYYDPREPDRRDEPDDRFRRDDYSGR